jgi:hypothetical protein
LLDIIGLTEGLDLTFFEPRIRRTGEWKIAKNGLAPSRTIGLERG